MQSIGQPGERAHALTIAYNLLLGTCKPLTDTVEVDW